MAMKRGAAGAWRRWLRWGQQARGTQARGQPAAPLAGAAAVSRPNGNALGEAWRAFLPLPSETPFEMLRVYRFLRDAIPDVSDAVWTWKRLCQTGYDVSIVASSSELAEARARRLIDGLNQRVNSGDRGMDGLLDILYESLFTYGAAAFEIVPARNGGGIWDVVPVDVWTVRFRRERGRLRAYQLQQGKPVALPPERFLYLGLDRDGTNPYGRSILRSIPFVAKIQQRMLEDMAKAVHNAGWSRLHVQYEGEDRLRGESDEDYQARMAANLEALRSRLSGLQPDQNLVTYGNVSVSVLQGSQRQQVFYENQKAVEEQVITGMHLMPILLGRNYGTTETYGTAQYEIINRQVEAVNRQVKRLLERLYNRELALMWGEAQAAVHFRHNRTADVLKDAQARGKEIDNALRLREAGLIDAEETARMLNLPGVGGAAAVGKGGVRDGA